ncbi:unnamed protein product, partial [Amoebophrya sp. A25]|eukprot:GSA25T00027615001.1
MREIFWRCCEIDESKLQSKNTSSRPSTAIIVFCFYPRKCVSSGITKSTTERQLGKMRSQVDRLLMTPLQRLNRNGLSRRKYMVRISLSTLPSPLSVMPKEEPFWISIRTVSTTS